MQSCVRHGKCQLAALQIDEQDALDRLLEKDAAEATASLYQDECWSSGKVDCPLPDMTAQEILPHA